MLKNFSQLILNFKKEQQTFLKQKMLKNVILRKSVFLKHPLYVNNEATTIFLRHIKNRDELYDYVQNLKELNYQSGFILNSQLSFNTMNFLISFDVVLCDLNWRVIKFYKSLNPNQTLGRFQNVVHIFILCDNTITYYNINVGNVVCPIQKIN